VTQALKKRPKPGTKFAYLQCASPVCAGFATFLKPAAQAMGVRLTITPAGPAADSLQNAMNSIISERPAAVILPGVQFDTILPQLTTLHKLGIPVVAYSLDAAKYHIIPIFDVPKAVRTAGQLMAAWAVSQEGAKTNAVFYTTPEINLSPLEEQAFNAELKHLCPSCATRTVTVSITTIGSTAPQAVVSDLQSHPKTNVAVFAIEEAATGLPAAMRAANLQDKVKVVGYGPDPGTLRQIQTGNIAAGGAEDSAIENWTLVDAVARLLTHQALTPAETSGTPPTQMVTAGDLKGKNLTLGYLSYPNYASLFTKAWAGR
jgi:ribose transport system substrate-binding protein